jgi:hypothetical protein
MKPAGQSSDAIMAITMAKDSAKINIAQDRLDPAMRACDLR